TCSGFLFIGGIHDAIQEKHQGEAQGAGSPGGLSLFIAQPDRSSGVQHAAAGDLRAHQPHRLERPGSPDGSRVFGDPLYRPCQLPEYSDLRGVLESADQHGEIYHSLHSLDADGFAAGSAAAQPSPAGRGRTPGALLYPGTYLLGGGFADLENSALTPIWCAQQYFGCVWNSRSRLAPG